MAHGDHYCCAVCDQNVGHAGWDTETKAAICGPCQRRLRDASIEADTPAAFIEWVSAQPPDVLAATLARLGYKRCFYANAVDDAIDQALGERGRELNLSGKA